MHQASRDLCSLNPPFGIRPLCDKHGDKTREFVNALQAPRNCSYRTCAVVGASGNLIHSHYGHRIDTSDAVFRINYAPLSQDIHKYKKSPHFDTQAWDRDIGTRTTWRIMTMESFCIHAPVPSQLAQASSRARPTLQHVQCSQIPSLWNSLPSAGDHNGQMQARTAQTNIQGSSTNYWIDPSFVHRVQKEHFDGTLNQKLPSTGMIAITVALKMCNTVDVYGFTDGFCSNDCYHYYDCRKIRTNSPTSCIEKRLEDTTTFHHRQRG